MLHQSLSSAIIFAMMKLLGVALTVAVALADEPVGYSIVSNYSRTLLKEGQYGSQLFQLEVGALGEGTTFFIDLHGDTRYNLGYEQASMIGDQMIGCFDAMLNWMTGGISPLKSLIQEFLVWQWTIALSTQTPPEYLEELRGMTAASTDLNLADDVGALAAAGIVLTNFPGDGDDFIYVLLNEVGSFIIDDALAQDLAALLGKDRNTAKQLSAVEKNQLVKEALVTQVRWPKPGCSNFGVWGSRTEGGALFSGRNLDYSTDTGINDFKLVSVIHPPEEGRFAHATVGFACLVGALTGMSAAGLTVHEANLESDQDTFFGFPWMLRLRDVMERASTMEEALALWGAANNTVGFNHALGSGMNEKSGAPQFAALETDAGHTALFYDMDSREAQGLNGTPRSEAVFRTNHGFDPETVSHYMWNGTGADADSEARYALYAPLLDAYEAAGGTGAIGHLEAVRIAAVIAGKSDPTVDDAYVCDPTLYHSADNVVSVAFNPKAGSMYAAWEVGSGDSWVPAACSTYIYVDLAPWW